MPTSMSYTRIVRPKNRTPKFSLVRTTSYNIFKGDDGKLKMTKTVSRKIRVNKI